MTPEKGNHFMRGQVFLSFVFEIVVEDGPKNRGTGNVKVYSRSLRSPYFDSRPSGVTWVKQWICGEGYGTTAPVTVQVKQKGRGTLTSFETDKESHDRHRNIGSGDGRTGERRRVSFDRSRGFSFLVTVVDPSGGISRKNVPETGVLKSNGVV